MGEKKLCGRYEDDVRTLDGLFGIEKSFDAVKREITVAKNTRAALYFIDGMVKDQVMNRIMEYMVKAETAEECIKNLPYVEVDGCDELEKAVYLFMSGAAVFYIEGRVDTLIIDTRTYPVRGVSEPENDRVLRGPHHGFVETLIFNTALIRRHIRDEDFAVSMINTGGVTKTDVVLCYMESKADKKLLKTLSEKLKSLPVKAVNMGAQSIAECLISKRWYDPFPKIRYTERPDAAAAMILEGSVVLLCDGSPLAMILPTSIFDFLQTSDDFYFPPLVGSYLRILRLCVFLATLLVIPTWYLLISHPEWVPARLEMLLIGENDCKVPILVQILVVELVIDGLKMASMNTPSSLNNSLSIVGGLILGDFAVSVGWLLPQVIIFMAFVAIANFTQQSYELGYAFKFMRMILLLCTAAFGIYGYAGALLFTVALVVFNKSVDGSRGYLYPLIPFNGRALKRLIFRVRLK